MPATQRPFLQLEDATADDPVGMGRYGGHFFCRVAIFNALGTIEGSCLELQAA